MAEDPVIVEEDGGITRITINRPDKLNALTPGMTKSLADTFERLARDDSVRVVVLRGAGRAFCAGADTTNMGTASGPSGNRSPDRLRRNFLDTQRLILGITSLEVPVVGVINGDAVGAGFDIACACDLRVAAESARFMMAYTRIGLVPGWGGTWFLPRLLGLPKAAELLFTGRFLSAPEALQAGFLNDAVPSERLDERAEALVQTIASGPPIALRLNKIQLLKGLEMPLEAALRFAAITETVTLTSEDHQEGVAAFREKRRPKYRGI